MDKSELKESIDSNSEKLYSWAIILSILLVLISTAALSHFSDNPQNLLTEPDNQKLSPIGLESDNPEIYKFAEHKEGILFGPYLLNDSNYYVYENKVLNAERDEVNNTRVRGLHNFYLKTYFDPLFYSPSNQEPFQKEYEQFENDKILSRYCDLEYDLVPTSYFESLNENHNKTGEFFKTASYENAKRLLESNLQATKSYSEYVGNFLELTQKNISGNKCFRGVETSGIAKATRTPTQYRIDDEVIRSHVKMANRNSKILLQTIEERKKLLKAQKTVNLSSEVPELVRPSQKYEELISPAEAKDEMNKRRVDETSETLNLEEKNDEAEKESSHSHGPDTHTHSGEETNNSEEDSGEPVHGSQAENGDDERELTPEQEKFARLVEEEPVQFDVEPFCMERNQTPIYGWDRNIYPNLIRGQDILLQDKRAMVRDFFTVSRCPYVEITRLKWYNLNDLYTKVETKKLSKDYSGKSSADLKKAEEIFLENPGEKTIDQLSRSYTYALKESLKEGRLPEQTSSMWRRSLQEESKLNAFEDTYEDFYNEQHMRVWDSYFPEPSSNESRRVYNNFLLLESLYALNFNTWSDSIWRLEEKPKRFSGIIGKR